jgi:hypothetical protein
VTDIWSRLGIGATGDLKAIKSAYAARLKHTRPDDDAAAYQALREAYEEAQAHARQAGLKEQQRQESPIDDAIAPQDKNTPATITIANEQPPQPHPPEHPGEPASPTPTTSATPIEPSWRAPDELAQALERLLAANDAGAAVAQWPALERELDQLPLSMHAEVSRCFADVALAAHGELLPPIRNALLRRFGWLHDFRATQALGAQRAQALRARFGGGAVFVPDEAFLRRYRFAFAFAQGAQDLKGWAQTLYIALASSHIRRLWRQLGPAQRDAAGVDPAVRQRIDRVLSRSRWPRLAVLAALGASTFGGRESSASGSWVLYLFMTIYFGTMGWFGLRLVQAMAMLIRHHFMPRLFGAIDGRGWIGIPLRTLAATACLIVASACIAAVESRSRYTPFGAEGIITVSLALSFLLAQWPRSSADSVLPWVLLLSCFVGAGLLDLACDMPWTGAAFGALWFMLNILIDRPHPSWRAAMPRPGWTAPGLLTGLVAWPATVMLWARKQAPEPAIAACGLALMATPLDSFALLFPLWMIYTLVVFGLDIAFAICGQALRHQRWKSGLHLSVLLIWLAWAVVFLGMPDLLPSAVVPGKAASRLDVAGANLLMVGLLPGACIALGAGIIQRARKWLRR